MLFNTFVDEFELIVIPPFCETIFIESFDVPFVFCINILSEVPPFVTKEIELIELSDVDKLILLLPLTIKSPFVVSIFVSFNSVFAVKFNSADDAFQFKVFPTTSE